VSRAPVTDPQLVPFTYVTEAASFVVRGGTVEVTFVAERVLDESAEEPAERIVEARLAMPIDAAAGLSEALSRIMSHRAAAADEGAGAEAEEATDEPIAPSPIASGAVLLALSGVVRGLLDHVEPAEGRAALLKALQKNARKELKNVDIAGARMADEAPAIESALRVMDQLFRTWRAALKK
jgi:hypothetical protein